MRLTKNLVKDQVLPVGALGLGLSSPLNEGSTSSKNSNLMLELFFQSGRWDLNPGPLAPHASALAGLRYAPIWTSAIIPQISPLGRGRFFFHPN